MKSKVARIVRSLPAPVRAALLLVLLAVSLVSAIHAVSAVVTENPRNDLPIALDGQVWAIEQVGNTVVVGGNFTQVQTSRNGPVVDQAALYAYDIDTGEFDPNFRPTLIRNNALAEVRDLQISADGTGVYVGGRFTAVDDGTDGRVRVRNRLALFNVDSGRLDRNFAQGGVDAAVLSLDLDRWGRLYVGGTFETVFDLAPGRPPIEQTVRGLARFNATTGQFDTDFRYESHDDIGRINRDLTRTRGVARVVLHPAGRILFVAHRGAEIRDTITGETFDSPGIARIDIGAATHRGREFKALHPDADDPIQDFYHGGQCRGVGVGIRDMAVGGNFLVLVHQGGDSGAQCDTTVRFSTDVGEKRPDWVSRAFDSILSVEIDGPHVYIGGHFRYLVNNTAPSPYPGRSLANGEGGSQVYIADPERDDAFRVDLVEPGFVYRALQLGVLSATTGFGDPSFNPGSNAALGVLELTAVDRGILLGQDNDRVNGILTGRSAFLDNEPDLADPSCRVSLTAAGTPIVAWSNIGDVRNWNIAANGDFVATQPGTATRFVHTDAGSGEQLTYQLRYNRFGNALVQECGSITTPQPTLQCTASLRAADGQVTLRWNDEGWSRVAVRANGRFVESVDAGTTAFVDTATIGTTTYSIRAFSGGQRFQATCGAVVVAAPAAPVLTCSATVNVAGNLLLRWNDVGASSYQIRTNGSWTQTLDAGTTQFVTANNGSTVEIRYRLAGERFDSRCR